jgi:hypothetical protein
LHCRYAHEAARRQGGNTFDKNSQRSITLSHNFFTVFGRMAIAACTLHAAQVLAAPCDDHFSSSGNFLAGKVFKTWADLPSANPASAFRNVMAFTVANGFSIVAFDAAQGSISAMQTASIRSGKKTPLDIAIENLPAGVKVSMIYSTPPGALSPEDAVKTHFCKTIAAAESGNAPVTSNQAQPAPAAHSAAAGLNLITPDQQARIAKEFDKKIADAKLAAMIADAAPTIKDFISRESCLQQNKMDYAKFVNLFTIYAAPEKHLYIISPLNQTPYHNKAACLSVARIQGWQALAKNALKFEVIYLAEDSDESARTSHEMVKQPDGTWLFNQ